MQDKLLQLFHHFKESKGFRQTMIMVVGNFGATGVSAITIILLSRLLGPEQFGSFTVGFAVVLILSRVFDAGLDATLLKYASDQQELAKNNALFSYTIKIKLWLTGALALSSFILGPLTAKLLNFDQPAIMTIAFLLGGFSVWYEQLITMLQASHKFKEAVLANLYQSLAKLTGISALFLLGWKSSLITFSWYMFAPIIPVLVAGSLLPKSFKLNLNQDFSKYQSFMLKMARHSAVGFIAAGLIENIDVLFVQKYLSTYETGLLGGVSRISMMILLVAYSLGNVLYPRVAQYKDATNMAKYMQKAVVMMLAALVGFLVFIPFSRLSILLTIGPEYLAGDKVLLILAGSSFLTLATIPFLALFYVFNKEWYFSVSGIGQLAIILFGNALFVPTYGLEAAAWTRLVCRIFLFAFTVGLAVFTYKKEMRKSLRSS